MTKFEELLSCIKNPMVYIQTHNYPDPDALASARGLQYLLEQKGVKAVICYKGHIDKFNTLSMIDLLHIDIKKGSELPFTEKDEIILVDCQKGNNNVKDFDGEEIACIDHHKKQETSCYRCHDIRSDMGSCASIIAGYFVENKIAIHTEIATLLLYGIKMDTANLTRGVSDNDVDMFGLLYRKADKEILRQLEASTINLSDLKAYAKAIEDLRVYDCIGFSNIGNNCSEAIIGTLSDFILSLCEVQFSMVYSYRAGGLKFSVRSKTTDFDCADIIKEALKGYGDGGGHALMAAGFIPNLMFEEAIDIAYLIEDRVMNMICR